MFCYKLLCIVNLFNLFIPCISYPTIVIHGIASNKNELEPFSNELYNELNSIKSTKSINISQKSYDEYQVYNMEIGNGKLTSIFTNINEQCQIFANNIQNLNIVDEKINIIGFSQGGLIARCYLEKYSSTIKEVNTLITIATPHMGIYNSNNLPLPNAVKFYWKDPYKYSETNKFILNLNNEIYHNDYITYKNNIESISNFILIWSKIDTVITPLESSKFEFYDITKATNKNELQIQPLTESPIYLNDTLGIKELYISNRMLLHNIDCLHQEFKLPKCFKDMGLIQLLKQYLTFT